MYEICRAFAIVFSKESPVSETEGFLRPSKGMWGRPDCAGAWDGTDNRHAI